MAHEEEDFFGVFLPLLHDPALAARDLGSGKQDWGDGREEVAINDENV